MNAMPSLPLLPPDPDPVDPLLAFAAGTVAGILARHDDIPSKPIIQDGRLLLVVTIGNNDYAMTFSRYEAPF